MYKHTRAPFELYHIYKILFIIRQNVKKWTVLACRVCITLSFAFLAFLMLRCNCKNYRASFRLCLFCYCFCRKRSIAPLLSRAFLSELPMALHGAINIHLIFAHYLYRVSCPASIHRTCGSIFYRLFSYHKVIYNAKRENFESSICATHDASLFFIQVIHRTLLNRVYVITMITTYCLCLPYIHLHSIHN